MAGPSTGPSGGWTWKGLWQKGSRIVMDQRRPGIKSEIQATARLKVTAIGLMVPRPGTARGPGRQGIDARLQSYKASARPEALPLTHLVAAPHDHREPPVFPPGCRTQVLPRPGRV